MSILFIEDRPPRVSNLSGESGLLAALQQKTDFVSDGKRLDDLLRRLEDPDSELHYQYILAHRSLFVRYNQPKAYDGLLKKCRTYGITLIQFTGDISAHSYDQVSNILNIPPSLLYHGGRLLTFIDRINNGEILDPQFLIYGDYIRLAEGLRKRHEEAYNIDQDQNNTKAGLEFRPLLIHNDNLGPLIDILPWVRREHIDISPEEKSQPDFDLDRYYHDWIEDNLWVEDEEPFHAICLPFCLSKANFLELDGLRLAHHIRLSKSSISRLPIIFLGQETKDEIIQLSDLGGIIMTPGIFSCRSTDPHEIVKYITDSITRTGNISNDDYQKYLTQIVFSPLDNYDSRHSVANEWGLAKLSAMYGVEGLDESTKLRALKSSLYYKHKTVSKKDTVSESKNARTIDCSGMNVLFIDDRAKEGWEDLFGHILKGAQIETPTWKSIKDVDSLKKIVTRAYQKQKFWDLILLDIRLLETDNESSKDFTDYSGFEILDMLTDRSEKGDPWNNIILTSASNKHVIYDYGKQLGALGFLIKPGLDTPDDQIETFGFEDSIKLAKRLKAIRIGLKAIEFNISAKKLRSNSSIELRKFINNELQILLDLSYDFAKQNKIEFAYFNIYAIMEYFARCLTSNRGITYPSRIDILLKDTNNSPNINGWELTYNPINKYYSKKFDPKSIYDRFEGLARISAVGAFIFELDDNELKEIGRLAKIRNEIAHGGRNAKKNKSKTDLDITIADINKLLQMVNKFSTKGWV